MARADDAKKKIEDQVIADGLDVDRVHEPTSVQTGAAPVLVTTWRACVDVKGREAPVWYETQEYPVGTFSTPVQGD